MANKRPVATLAVLAGIVIILILIGTTNSFGIFGNFFRGIFNPLAGLMYRVSSTLHPAPSSGLSTTDLEARLKTIEEDNQRLSAENVRLLNLEDENRRLREYFNFSESRKYSLQMAEVIARGVPEDSWRNREVITLNQGSKQGLVVGMPIVNPQGVLLGKLTAVKDNLSEACLLYSSDCRMAVGLADQGSTIGVAHGDLGLTVLIEFIPQNFNIAENKTVVTSGLETGMPPGLLIGKVSRVIKQSNELWQSAIIEPAASFENLRFVAVLK